MTLPPEFQSILDDFEEAADAALRRADKRINQWLLNKARIEHQRYSISMLEPIEGFDTYMGVPVDDILSGKEPFPGH